MDFDKIVREETNKWCAERGYPLLPEPPEIQCFGGYPADGGDFHCADCEAQTPADCMYKLQPRTDDERRQDAESRGQTRRTESDDLREGDLAGRIRDSHCGNN